MAENIYTLAQSRTKQPVKPAKLVNGNGSDLNEGLTATGRSKRKFITTQLNLALIDVAKEMKDAAMEKTFWNAFHCQRKITSANGIVYGNYCKNRSCMVCMSIRKAEMINRYFPIIEKWDAPYFVTLTAKACTAKYLDQHMDKMVKSLQLICDRQRKRHERGQGIKLVGVRSLESNFNPKARTYNPHFHLIVETEEMAKLLVQEWVKMWPPRHALPECQHYTKINSVTKSLIEVIKYGSKIFVDPEGKKCRSYKPQELRLYAKALYTILKAMKGRRLFDRFGFNADTEPRHYPGAKVIIDFSEWTYSLKKCDWVNRRGETLTNYTPTVDHIDLITGIDFSLY